LRISYSADQLIIDCPATDQLGHFSWKSQRCVWCLAPAPLNLSTELSSWSSAEKFSSWSAEQFSWSAEVCCCAVLSAEVQLHQLTVRGLYVNFWLLKKLPANTVFRILFSY